MRKDQIDRSKHKISLERASEFDFSSALVYPDDSQDYGEEREIALGFLTGTLYLMVYVVKTELRIRVISLRKASSLEEVIYAEH